MEANEIILSCSWKVSDYTVLTDSTIGDRSQTLATENAQVTALSMFTPLRIRGHTYFMYF